MSPARKLLCAAVGAAALFGCEARTEKLADGVWAITVPGVANYGIVSGEFGTVVIDSGPGPVPGSELSRLAERLTMCEVTYLVNTSADPRRVLGNQSFKHAEIVAHSGVSEELGRRGESMIRRLRDHPRARELGAGECRIAPPTVTFEDRLTLRMPDRVIVVTRPGGGPAPGASVVLLPKEKILFAGEYVRVRTAPELDEDADLPAWIASLDTLAETAAGCRVVPGAGETAGSECIRWMRDYLRELHESVTAMVAAGATLEETLGQVQMRRYRGWAAHSERLRSNVTSAYHAAVRAARRGRAPGREDD